MRERKVYHRHLSNQIGTLPRYVNESPLSNFSITKSHIPIIGLGFESCGLIYVGKGAISTFYVVTLEKLQINIGKYN